MGVVSLSSAAAFPACGSARAPPTIQLHDTFFVVAHFHLIMAGAALFGVFGATSNVVPQDVRPHDETDTLASGISGSRFVTYYGTFFPMHYIGLAATCGASTIPTSTSSSRACSR